ncbi:MAG: 3-deoxy-7-phosphoheptulonate synthase [Candidatus Dadabacteria bacterium]|nr:3-deoxy-7-phosphoheptulonate synthase [Candidatus Dadabacteria bacterium]MYA48834.1 3-deoxy-7-phosphoheptulonate synthase [Candidatus Dadabacteria bacterium]MYF47416.1 3-deoxy-7-phosphoheptulonate synthase [Candidatus Dadabacteria bacterium]MYG83151.1 3-deoxy-7-phosphoheptulonate synthase [Candidatus Dadabacteria bacterium]MYK49432.1 3-deoxy-7-phosphoheptulonate synthase [Candidatus Dadabacteria bacterium]
MIVVMKQKATKEEIDKVKSIIKELGYSPHPIEGILRTVIGVVGDDRGKPHDLDVLKQLQGVEKVVPVLQPYKLTSREVNDETSVFNVKDVAVGDKRIPIIAGPCSVESEEQIMTIAASIKDSGASMLRGGAFKPRTSPYSFQGLGKEGLELLVRAKEMTGLPIVTEIMSPDDLELVEEYADVLQIGARNSQNYSLLRHVGKSKKAVLLKRGMSTTINEFLMCAEYILSEGNSNVMLCERGIRTFETATRNTFDLNAIPVLKEKTHLPVFADPSHGTGYWQYVIPVTLASIAAGADGVIVEVHNNPEVAVSDGAQSLKPKTFKNLMEKAAPVAEAIGRTI